uniref:Uncharacterized protein n=1 Tax=Lactuca sativa TaxID=4236 RepID=A0A9R1UGI6_LACSA|nr:hypothetical protein LSAT_V11C900483330 [Lactuca sativa]
MTKIQEVIFDECNKLLDEISKMREKNKKSLNRAFGELKSEHENSLKSLNKSITKSREITLQNELTKTLACIEFLRFYSNVVHLEELAKQVEAQMANAINLTLKMVASHLKPLQPVIKTYPRSVLKVSLSHLKQGGEGERISISRFQKSFLYHPKNFKFVVQRDIMDDIAFSIGDFPNLYPHDLVVLLKFSKDWGLKAKSIVMQSIKTFLCYYYKDIARTDIVLDGVINPKVK